MSGAQATEIVWRHGDCFSVGAIDSGSKDYGWVHVGTLGEEQD